MVSPNNNLRPLCAHSRRKKRKRLLLFLHFPLACASRSLVAWTRISFLDPGWPPCISFVSMPLSVALEFSFSACLPRFPFYVCLVVASFSLSVSHPFAPAAPFSHRFFFSVFLYRAPLLGVRTVTLSLHYRRRFSSSESVSAWVPLSRSCSWCFERVCGEKVFRISFCLLMEIKRVIKRSSKMSKHHISCLFHSQENGFSRDVSTALHLFIGHFFPSLLLTFSFLLAAVFTDISFPSAHSGGH
ncbi:hypothetical protein TGGT1_227940 [Toxoplasma gondii GT1]|uniref:Transmembrane protein n=1 Tax=Toxoplasma gondii (strain ATCC 50853 / GT1) TaxID=507601 RepID=S7UXB4_TOXGG|nr:hypothetical protein TGGT1_227940 [Toxoplasma gondii GT1]